MASKHYVNNKSLYEAIIKYKETCIQYKLEQRNSKPNIPRYIGECLYMMAKKYATKPNFSGYTFIDDMISDALENCIAIGVDNFDPNKTSNPFAYFTQIIHFAFIRRIQKEKKQQYIKAKLMIHLKVSGGLAHQQEMDDLHDVDSSQTSQDYMNDLIVSYENNIRLKRIKTKAAKEQKIADEKMVAQPE